MNHVVESYENYREEDRFNDNSHRIEFITTVKAFESVFPKSGKVLDCAAGTGAYAFWLAEKGYDVTALDITPRHIEYINEQLKTKNYIMQTAVNNATDLSCFEDNTFDIVLCMGPIYHLVDEKQRNKCIGECRRVLKPGGFLTVAYINLYSVFPYVATKDKRYLQPELAKKLLTTGTVRHEDTDCFWTDTYYPKPCQMEAVFKYYDIETVEHVATDGLSAFLREKLNGMSDEEYKLWVDYHLDVCKEREILGTSLHGLIIGRKPIGL